jgi:hypothetical protein
MPKDLIAEIRRAGNSKLGSGWGLANLLDQTIENEVFFLRALPEHLAACTPKGPDSWSPKQELGHLIDSAANNHIRFVRGALEPEYRGSGYAQNEWVDIHGYQDMPWSAIIDVWSHYNALLVRLVARIPEASMNRNCFIGSSEPVTLAFLIGDYILHMRHHTDHLLNRPDITPYPSAAPVR